MVSRYQLGEVVFSKAGRDFDNAYLVVDIENKDYIKVADGDKKKIERPKRKNKKHLRKTGDVFGELSIWLSEGKRVRNEDIKKFLKDYQKK